MSRRSRRVEEDALKYARAFNYVSLGVAELRYAAYAIPRSAGRVNDLRNVSRQTILPRDSTRRLGRVSYRLNHIAVFSDFQKEQSDTKQRTSASSTYNTFPDDLYLDDQDVEGSGRGGSDNRDDLEASGSGLGPDDEDGDDDHGMISDISI